MLFKRFAHLPRLGILPIGYICPPELRAVRDLARKRTQLVRQRTTKILSIENLYARNLGVRINGNAVKRLTVTAIEALGLCAEQQLALKANLAVLQCLSQEISALEQALIAQMMPDYRLLWTVPGIGEVLAFTMSSKPRINLIRYHGAFAPHHTLRAQLTPARRGRRAASETKTPAERHSMAIAFRQQHRLSRLSAIHLSAYPQFRHSGQVSLLLHPR